MKLVMQALRRRLLFSPWRIEKESYFTSGGTEVATGRCMLLLLFSSPSPGLAGEGKKTKEKEEGRSRGISRVSRNYPIKPPKSSLLLKLLV
jgi:hypothetical protein